MTHEIRGPLHCILARQVVGEAAHVRRMEVEAARVKGDKSHPGHPNPLGCLARLYSEGDGKIPSPFFAAK